MRGFLCLAFFLGVGVAGSVGAAPPAPEQRSPPGVDRLIAQLGDKDYRVRDKAGKALAALGKEALPAFLNARTYQDAEVRKRLDELIPPIERAVLLSPKRVTLHLTNKPLRDIFSEVTRQTGYKILTGGQGQAAARVAAMDPRLMELGFPPPPPPPQSASRPATDKSAYTFHFDQLPFWEAFDKICTATGMVLQNTGDDSLYLSAQDSYVPFVSYAGPFKVVATGFTYGRNTDFSQVQNRPYAPGQSDQEYLQLGMQVSTEPKAPIMMLGQVKLLQAEDEEKHSMMPRGDGNEYGLWGIMRFRRFRYYNRGNLHHLQVGLAWPDKNCRTVRTLRGLIPVTLLAEQKPTVITDKLLASKNKKFKVGTTTFHVEDVSSQAGKQYQVRLAISEEGQDVRRDFARMQTVQQRLEVQDDKGNKLPFFFNSINWGGTNAQFSFTLRPTGPNQGPPTRLVYNVWVLMEHEVPFEFKDLPLP
jgi:hypothetical protein